MDWSEYTRLLLKKSKETNTPASATFELTPFCNFNCNMCYIHLTPEQAKSQGNLLSTEQWLHIAKECKVLGTLGLEVTGGEAITRPDFPLLYEAFIKMGFLITLRSNGYLLRNDFRKLLQRYKPRCISITLYGGSDETYHSVCGIDDGFSVTTENILALREMGIEPRLTVTVTKDNFKDRDKLIKWAENNDFHISFYGGLLTPIRSAKRSIEHLKVDYIHSSPDTDDDLLLRDVQERQKYMHPFWMCREYGSTFCITWDGRMTLCNCLPSIWSNALLEGVESAFNSLYSKLELVNRPPECGSCQYIDYCDACPARLFSESGSVDKVTKNICMMAKLTYKQSLLSISQKASLNKENIILGRNEINEN